MKVSAHRAFNLLKELAYERVSCSEAEKQAAQKLLEVAQDKLPNGQIDWFYSTVLLQMQQNLARVHGDLDWFIEKFDYRNASAPWKNSKDAVSRSMQKLKGLYPADPNYRQD